MRQAFPDNSVYRLIEATSTTFAQAIILRLHLPPDELPDIRQDLILVGVRAVPQYRSGKRAIGTYITEKLKWACKDILRRFLAERRRVSLFCESEVIVSHDGRGSLVSRFDFMADNSKETDIIGIAEKQSIIGLMDGEERDFLRLLDAGHTPRGAALRLGWKPWKGADCLKRIQEKLLTLKIHPSLLAGVPRN